MVDNPFESQCLDDDACFLCGSKLGGNGSQEHVYPRWLQEKFNLWDLKLQLINSTTIYYRQLTIPCCQKCNNEDLSTLEGIISNGLRDGYDSFIQIDEFHIFQWAAKIYYGILRKELMLLNDRKAKNKDTIIPQEILEDMKTLHLFLQSIRRPVEFSGEKPYTVLVANLHTNGQDDFFFRDNLAHLVIMFRVGEIGIIVSLEDCSINEHSTKNIIRSFGHQKLHALQLEELYARVVYQTSLLNRIPKFISTAHIDDISKPLMVRMLPLGGMSSQPVINDWDQKEFSEVLCAILYDWLIQIDVEPIPENLYIHPDKVKTWLLEENGGPYIMNEEGDRIRARSIFSRIKYPI